MKLNAPVIALGLVLGLTAVATTVVPRPEPLKRTEDWLAAQLPTRVGDYSYIHAGQPSSYKMDEMTYGILKPSGIVARVYERQGTAIDVVIINSTNGDSFHDPSICFQSQGPELLDQRVRNVPTQSRGNVPVTFLRTTYNGQQRLAAFTYKGPGGMTAGPFSILMDLFRGEITTGRSQEGNFYRFIALSPVTTEDDLAKFVGEYLDTVAKTSDGVL